MEIRALCAVVAALRVCPDRSQFFQYESVSLSCGPAGNATDWSLRRNTSHQVNQERFCLDPAKPSRCFIDILYPSDTGAYWCQSAAGERSRAVMITVTGGSVILDSPAGPVAEGEDVVLRCRERKASSNHTADFYKDGRLVGSSSAGGVTVRGVSQSDEGLYRCNVSGTGRSPHSWLTVTGRPAPPDSRRRLSPRPVVAVCVSLVSLVSLASLASLVSLCCSGSHKGGKGRAGVTPSRHDVPYADVIVRQDVLPQRAAGEDAAQTLYAEVKPGA